MSDFDPYAFRPKWAPPKREPRNPYDYAVFQGKVIAYLVIFLIVLGILGGGSFRMLPF